MKEKIIMKNKIGESKLLSLDNDIVLIILSIFNLGWIKLFVDGRISQGFINLVLTYTVIGSIIHGVYLGLKPQSYLKELLKDDYEFTDISDLEYCKKIYPEVFNG